MTQIQTRNYSFQDLGLKQELLNAIRKNGIESPSEVQQKSIPYILERSDVLVQAKSGLGKTLCFVLSILQMLQPNQDVQGVQPQALILANTKELAVQITDEFKRFAIELPQIHIQHIIGGLPIDQQIKLLKDEKPNIIVATVGRLADLLRRKEIDLSRVEYFVIDEADTMLCPRKGSEKQNIPLQQIFDSLKQKHLQTMMFSATFTEESKKLAVEKLNNSYKKIELSDDKLFLHGLKQSFVRLTEAQKLQEILKILENEKFNQCIIFAKNQDRVKALQQYLVSQQVQCKAFYSGLTTLQRTELYKEFKQKQFRVIVSTDIFQRGVDFEQLDLVIHFDMPNNSDSYLHRSGRAGRFETKGIVISFVTTEEDENVLKEIQDRFIVKIEEQKFEE